MGKYPHFGEYFLLTSYWGMLTTKRNNKDKTGMGSVAHMLHE
jgi:hypothetical protein